MSPSLHIEDLYHSFGEIVAIDGLSLSLSPQSCLAIVGPNGAGKSTLLNCISGWYQPLRGTISLEGQSIVGLSPTQIARLGVGRTFQQPQYFESLSVREHLRLAGRRLRRTQEQIEHDLRVCGLQEVAGRSPKALSHQEQKRLALALCLAMDSKLVLLDEPAAGLNQNQKQDYIQLIQQLQQQYQWSLLLVEHQMDLVAALADEVILLHQGKKLLQAPWEEIQRSTKWQQYYQ
ncbi:MAG: ATP-binding cassette domain-containing protein [Bacteroidota bacterium]